MKKIVIGILAHVDAGKTTLSEGMLYESGSIRKIGRVDNKDTFLDTYELERERGITIFSKQALLQLPDMQITLLDTPGHVDFTAEMERTLQVLDYAILVISGSDGIQGHTKTLWYLLKKYKIPVFVFVNKMDQAGTEKKSLLIELGKELDESCIDFSNQETNDFYERIAMSHESALDNYLKTESVTSEIITSLIRKRKIFPCFFGSALRLDGVKELLYGIGKYVLIPQYPKDFGARIFKIARDEQGNRLTYLKVTGGKLAVKMVLETNGHFEKINQIRVYSGDKYEVLMEAEPGTVCAVMGIDKAYPGEGIGTETGIITPLMTPVLRYWIQLPDGQDSAIVLPKLRQLEEEEPALHVVWDEEQQAIQCQIMGEVQIEILKRIVKDRFDLNIVFDAGNIVYLETITDTVVGVGHFEPLRHYAEVQLLLEPGESGSGLQVDTVCSVDILNQNWQKLILTHLREKEHKGVLTGASITDLKITVLAGRAHPKHTEGGDFRQATYRAVRQGLKQATSVLLEPFYKFRLEMPERMVGRAMTDIKVMHGTFEAPECENRIAVLHGEVPVATMRHYQTEFISYTKGEGRIFLQIAGYRPCHNAKDIIAELGYEAEKDTLNPTGSIFCSHGAGFLVTWDKVKEYQHLEGYREQERIEEETSCKEPTKHSLNDTSSEKWIADEEVTRIFTKTFYANSQEKPTWRREESIKKQKEQKQFSAEYNHKKEIREEYLLVDGYNIIFAWEDLNELAKENLESARGKLLDILCNYQAIKKCRLIVVFDAYRVEGHRTELLAYHNIHVVFTKEAETADQYIEKFAYQNEGKYTVTVATSDGLEQIIIRGKGCLVMSARDLLREIRKISEKLQDEYLSKQPRKYNYLSDSFSEDILKQIKDVPL